MSILVFWDSPHYLDVSVLSIYYFLNDDPRQTKRNKNLDSSKKRMWNLQNNKRRVYNIVIFYFLFFANVIGCDQFAGAGSSVGWATGDSSLTIGLLSVLPCVSRASSEVAVLTVAFCRRARALGGPRNPVRVGVGATARAAVTDAGRGVDGVAVDVPLLAGVAPDLRQVDPPSDLTMEHKIGLLCTST